MLFCRDSVRARKIRTGRWCSRPRRTATSFREKPRTPNFVSIRRHPYTAERNEARPSGDVSNLATRTPNERRENERSIEQKRSEAQRGKRASCMAAQASARLGCAVILLLLVKLGRSSALHVCVQNEGLKLWALTQLIRPRPPSQRTRQISLHIRNTMLLIYPVLGALYG